MNRWFNYFWDLQILKYFSLVQFKCKYCISTSEPSLCPTQKRKVLLLIVCDLFSQSLLLDEVITPHQVGGALGVVPQLWSIRLEIPSSSALGLSVHIWTVQYVGRCVCVRMPAPVELGCRFVYLGAAFVWIFWVVYFVFVHTSAYLCASALDSLDPACGQGMWLRVAYWEEACGML